MGKFPDFLCGKNLTENKQSSFGRSACWQRVKKAVSFQIKYIIQKVFSNLLGPKYSVKIRRIKIQHLQRGRPRENNTNAHTKIKTRN